MGDYFFQPIEDFSFVDDNFQFGSGQAGDPIYDAIVGTSGDPALWDQYLNVKGAREPFPHTYDQFIAQWRAFPRRALNSNSVPLLEESIVEGGKTAIVDQFKQAVQSNSDWAPIGLTDEEIANVALGAFNYFLRRFPYDEFPQGMTSEEFFGEWKKFMTVTAVVLSASKSGARTNMPSFEEIYQAFFPPGLDPVAAEAAFHQRLVEFVGNFIRGKGYFLPSQHVDDWTRELREQYERTYRIKQSPDERIRRGVMIMVFKILRLILERLQETAAMQAERLAFLTDYQAEYTEMMGRVPIYQATPQRLVGSIDLWGEAIDITKDIDGDNAFSKAARNQLYSGIGANNEGGMWEAKGFAGITLEEIREQGILMPTVFGFSEWQVRQSQADAGLAADGDLLNPGVDDVTTEGVFTAGEALPTGETYPIPEDSPYYYLAGEQVPGVWWLVEQPYDGSGKYGSGDDKIKDEADRRQDINQVRQQWIEQLRSRRNIVKDTAKQAQSNMSNTRESINQQSNLMTSIIQQLSSILQAIFR